jgi:aminopeptidase-like protein
MSQHLETIIKDLFPLNRCLLGEGYHNALLYIDRLIPLDIMKVKSGTQFGTWTVPDEWVVRDAWLKKDGEVCISYLGHPLSLVVGSLPFSGTVSKEELMKHLHYSSELPSAYPYVYQLYERDWGLTLPMNRVFKREGTNLVNILPEGDYEVHIDTEYRPGVMEIGVHTIPGKTDREVLLFAHLDHPFQANDNLSGVAALIDMVTKIKPKQYDHTIKLIFCPETIGSIAYAYTQNLTQVDFVLALDCVGNNPEAGIMLQKSFDQTDRINGIANLALRHQGGYRLGAFRSTIGSDEYVFNDPQFGVPGIMLTTHPYPEYHTSYDTPDTIDYGMVERVETVIQKIIEYYEKDYIPVRKFKAPLFRSAYGLQNAGKAHNLAWDYFIYDMDGTKSLGELCLTYGLNFELTYEQVEKLIADKKVSRRPLNRKGNVKKTPRKKP